jgi:hypothetical protein
MTEAEVLEAIGGWRVGCENAVEHCQMVSILDREGFLCIRRHFAPATPDGDPAYELTTMGLKRLALIGTDEQFKDAVNKRDWYHKNTSAPFPASTQKKCPHAETPRNLHTPCQICGALGPWFDGCTMTQAQRNDAT